MRRMTAGVFAGALLISTAVAVWAESPFNPKGSIRANLNLLSTAKKGVVVVLKNGQSYTARIGAVGNHHVVLTVPAPLVELRASSGPSPPVRASRSDGPAIGTGTPVLNRR